MSGEKRSVVSVLSLLVVCALAVYLAYGGTLYAFQDLQVFPAPGGVDRGGLDQAASEIGAEAVDLVAEDGTRLYGWYRRSKGERAVLYFHGNAEMVNGSIALQRQVAREGWDFLVIAYRGYPGSEGKPSEAGLAMDARAAWRWLSEERGIAPENIVIHGRSLGGGVGSRLASEVACGGLVLESTFTSALALASSMVPPVYLVERLLRHPFRTDLRAEELNCPVLILHSQGDRVIPVEHGRGLAALIDGAEYLELGGLGHEYSLVVHSPEGRKRYFGWLASRVERSDRGRPGTGRPAQ